jgi:dTDP-glucose pyrophosphorylase
MTSPTLLVLAAGMGSRYGGLKQLDPIGPSGETIMDYSLYDALRAGFSRVVFVLRQSILHSFQSTIAPRFQHHIAIDYVLQEPDNLPAGRQKPWGTAHAILTAASAITQPFAVINADDFYGATSYLTLADHLRSGTPDYAMVAFVLRNTLSAHGTVARGLCQVSPSGLLQTITEHTSIEFSGDSILSHTPAGPVTLNGNELVSMNLWGFTPAIFPQLQTLFTHFLRDHSSSLTAELYIPTAINTLIHTGEAHVKVLRTPDTWLGVTYREDRTRVLEGIRQLIAAGRYPERLWA